MNGTETIVSVVRMPQGILGLILLAICWPLNWTLPGMRTAFLFFPLWLGYILTVDALVLQRTGTSLWTRSRRDFWLHFVASAPVWWLFEIINNRTRNWEYLGSNQFTPLEYYLLCTLSFSTVMPAVFETAEFVRSFGWMGRIASGRRFRLGPWTLPALLAVGLAMIGLTLTWPRYFYPFVWASLLFILEPLNAWLGRKTLIQSLADGDWTPPTALALGALICGFFWEMWNSLSYPKWIYHTPGAQFLHIFEMPLLGYGGYITFGLELYALRNFLWPRTPKLEI